MLALIRCHHPGSLALVPEDVVLFHHLRLDPSSGASAGVPPTSPSRYSLVSQQQLKHIRAARSF